MANSSQGNIILTEEEKLKLLQAKQKEIIGSACMKAIKSIEDDLVYPDDDEINIYTDESCQRSLADKIKFFGEKDCIYGTSELSELLQKALVDKEYAPDALFGDYDSITAKEIMDAVDLDTANNNTNATEKIITDFLNKDTNENEVKQDYTEDNLYARQLANLPVDENGNYVIPRITVGHMVFTPTAGHEKLNFKTVYKRNESGSVKINWDTGSVTSTKTGETLGVITEYKRGYNDQEVITDAEYQEDREKDSWHKSMLINSRTGLSEEFDYLGRQINKDQPAKIRIVGIGNLLSDEEEYEEAMLDRALCGAGGSTYALDRQIEEAASGYSDLLSDWMSDDEFNNKPQHSLANGF